MNMDFYTAETSDITLNYYISASELIQSASPAFPEIPLTPGFIGFTFASKSFDMETGQFKNAFVKPIASIDNVDLFEIITTTGRSFKLSPNQPVVCVQSDIFKDENLLDTYYDLSIACGLDETCSIVINQGDTYIIEGISAINYIGKDKGYYILSSDNSFVLSNGLVLLNY